MNKIDEVGWDSLRMLTEQLSRRMLFCKAEEVLKDHTR